MSIESQDSDGGMDPNVHEALGRFFGAHNARAMPTDELVASFVPSDPWWELIKPAIIYSSAHEGRARRTCSRADRRDHRRRRPQPRRRFDPADEARLVHAIETRGFPHPILVKPHPERPDTYEVIDGERRLRAARQAGLTTVPAFVKGDCDPSDAGGLLLEAMLANDLGVKLDVLEEAQGYQRLITDAGYARKGIAQAFKIPQDRVRERLAILALPEPVQHDGTVPLLAVKALNILARSIPTCPRSRPREIASAGDNGWHALT